MRLYEDLTDWYRLLTPAEDYAEEAALYYDTMRDAVPDAETMLELGAGAGHNALFLKRDLRCTLTDVSAAMLRLSEEINPECEHVVGDMRSLRLGRTFDLVFVHDAVMYMASGADLRAAAETAFVHCRPGGAALFAPDCTTETFEEGTELFEGADGERAMRCLEWAHDPDPSDETFVVDFAFLLREPDGEVRVVHDRHVEGLFPRRTWFSILGEAGFEVDTFLRKTGPRVDELFLGRRPARTS